MRKLSLLLIFSLMTFSVIMAQETRTIRGRVTDAVTGEALIGATVFISPDEKQASAYEPQGTVTDYDGNYLFTLPKSVKKSSSAISAIRTEPSTSLHPKASTMPLLRKQRAFSTNSWSPGIRK